MSKAKTKAATAKKATPKTEPSKKAVAKKPTVKATVTKKATPAKKATPKAPTVKAAVTKKKTPTKKAAPKAPEATSPAYKCELGKTPEGDKIMARVIYTTVPGKKKGDPSTSETTCEIMVSRHGTKIRAEEDAKDFLGKDVFRRRSSLFPNPRSYGVDVVVKAANVIVDDHSTPGKPMMDKFVVVLLLEITGIEEAKVSQWAQALRDRAQTQLGTFAKGRGK